MLFCRDVVLTVVMLADVAEYRYVAFLSVVMLSNAESHCAECHYVE
jgi:hypothetical protein